MMFLQRTFLSAALLVSVLLPACQYGPDLVVCEDGTTPTTPTTPLPGTPTSIREVLTSLGAPTQTFTYDPTRQNQFTGSKGTQITIPANAFIRGSNGQLVTGPIQLQVREIFGKADMILSNMPTVSNGRLLESAGEIFLRPATDSTLRLAPGAVIQMQTQNPPNLASQDSMRLFVAPAVAPGTPTCFSWEVNFDPASSLVPTATGYQVSVSSALYNAGYGWFNCDRFYNTPNPLPIIVNVPGNDVDPLKNTMVFAVFRDMNGSLRVCDYTAPGTFKANGAPGGSAISVVVIRTVNGKLYYGRQDGAIAANFTFSPTLNEITTSDLQAVLNTL